MNLEGLNKLINNVIENEFTHIQEDKELEEVLANASLNILRNAAFELIDKLYEVAPEHAGLIDQLDSNLAKYYSSLCRSYFKKGVSAGTANLNFIKDVTGGVKFY